MSKVTQRAAVYAAFVNVFADNGIDFEAGMNASPLVTDKIRASVHQVLCEGFRKGTIVLADTPANRQKLASEAEMNKYVSGLISNWLRKDPDLNGDTKYVPKNPGSRTGQSDSQIQTLRALKTKFPEKSAAIDQAIEARKSELSAAKTKKVEVTPEMLEKLPAELRESLGLDE